MATSEHVRAYVVAKRGHDIAPGVLPITIDTVACAMALASMTAYVRCADHVCDERRMERAARIMVTAAMEIEANP